MPLTSSTQKSRIASLASIGKDIADSLRDLIRWEIRLAKAELRQSSHDIQKQATFMLVFGIFATLGTLPIIAAAVIGLGHLLGNNFWLSGLLVGITFLFVGGLIAAHAFQKLRSTSATAPHTRETLKQTAHDIAEETRRIA